MTQNSWKKDNTKRQAPKESTSAILEGEKQKTTDPDQPSGQTATSPPLDRPTDETRGNRADDTPARRKIQRKAKDAANFSLAPKTTQAKQQKPQTEQGPSSFHSKSPTQPTPGPGPLPEAANDAVSVLLATPEIGDHPEAPLNVVMGPHKTRGTYKLHYSTPTHTTIGCNKDTREYTTITSAIDYQELDFTLIRECILCAKPARVPEEWLIPQSGLQVPERERPHQRNSEETTSPDSEAESWTPP